MRTRLVATAAVLAVLTPSLAFAQASTATGVVGGAAAGAVIGGPVGAVVGGAIGGTVGAAAEPPADVRSYVVQESRPSVRLRREVVVGEPLPSNVRVYRVPNYNQYGYTVINNQRVIVEPGTRRVIEVIP